MKSERKKFRLSGPSGPGRVGVPPSSLGVLPAGIPRASRARGCPSPAPHDPCLLHPCSRANLGLNQPDLGSDRGQGQQEGRPRVWEQPPILLLSGPLWAPGPSLHSPVPC